ncbi:metallophosphoesterase family protein [Methanococcoides alaskense]|uniref:Phosphoesterase n=1 Tax=Methanococcoides alaskense TaxID=325778 RepID=A0AA90U0F8_9EURY|nr:YfcE family phosphodiesterase [Methanococcoides alaskense]MDA0525713.1 YfcE family phosphodiesterase [Methanococcoides alaskense]MDR6222939.1 putative phosphoesterase [Methanococcoides alaskense]
MKLIILSDTHIKPGQSLLELLPDDLVTIIKNSDILIHAGDFETLECYNELAGLGELVAVHGDTDVPELMELLPERQVIEVEGVRVGVIHKGQLTSDNSDGLRYLAKEMGVDVLIFGHFHHPIIEDYEVLLLSPGSAIVPGVAEPSAIELDIFEGKVKGRVIRCVGDACSYFEYERK